jgi:hypothetical protein
MLIKNRRFNVIKLILLLALLVLPQLSMATSDTATFGDKNSSNEYRIKADSDGLITFAQDTGIKYPYTTGSTNTTLTAAQTGTTFVFNNGDGTAANGTMFTLPTAVVGMRYTFIADVAKWMYIKPQSTDTINFASTATGWRINNSSTAAIGDNIELFCATANTWSARVGKGTWAMTAP